MKGKNLTGTGDSLFKAELCSNTAMGHKGNTWGWELQWMENPLGGDLAHPFFPAITAEPQ